MSEALQIPLDFERLPEFRLLVNALRSRSKPCEPRLLESNAVFVWTRLYVELALLAKSSNRPGYLTLGGRQLFESTLEPLFAEDCNPTDLLLSAGVLELRGEELFCPLFAQLNPHFASDYVSKERKGNAVSIVKRSEKHLAHEATAQAMLLPSEMFRKSDGTPMNDSEIQRAMMLIKRLDNCLKKTSRRKTEFGQGLIADAHDVAQRYLDKPDQLKKFYAWLITRRDHPRVPQTAEGVLKQFDELLASVE
ncbi:MAG: hypothetical protein ACTHLW_05965 [Verrucomicrobiota bacterium]